MIADEFEPAWQILQVAVARQCARFQWPAHRVLALAERCLSPGGWALRHPTANADGSLVFTDFEEAGWDDPAWVCASLFHPGGPAPFNYFRTFAGNLARSLGQGEGMVQRALVLMPLARLQQVLEANLEQANPPHNTRKLAAEFRRAWRDIAQMEVWQ